MSIPLNSSGLPEGLGCLSFRGRVYWMIYRDELGRQVQTNTRTDDFRQAQRILAGEAIRVLLARLAVLEAIRHEGQEETRANSGRSQAGHGGGHAGSSRSVRKDAALVREGRTKTARGGRR